MTQRDLFSQPFNPRAPRQAPNYRAGERVQFDYKGKTFTGTLTVRRMGSWQGVDTDDGRGFWVPEHKLRPEETHES
jgi:hypothetical protein